MSGINVLKTGKSSNHQWFDVNYCDNFVFAYSSSVESVVISLNPVSEEIINDLVT